MATRIEFLSHLWRQNINSPMAGHWIDNLIWLSENRPNDPFADLGIALKRLLDLGASRHDLNLIARHSAYEATFGALYAIEDPGVDEGESDALYESLLASDPSGKEGRPGSVPDSQ